MLFDNGDNFKKDGRCRYYVNPVGIVWSTQGGGRLVNPENLLTDDLSVCGVSANEQSAPAVVLDFGQEFNGGIEIHLSNPGPMPELKARIRFGESVSEVMGSPNNDHSVHDVTLPLSIMSKHEFGTTGFRFVRVDFLSCGVEVKLTSIKLIALERPYHYIGSFESSDALLNRIWQVGARTVHLCCQDYILDGIKRDRLLWVGDLHPQINVIGSVFGDVDIVNETLDQARAMAPAGLWMNGMSTYSLWWIVCVFDWYMYTGNTQWLKRQTDYLKRLVDQIASYIGDDGREQLPATRFIDWSVGLNEPVIDQGLAAITLLSMQKAAGIFKFAGCPDYAANAERIAAVLKKYPVTASDVKQVNSMRVLAGLITAKEANEQSLSISPCEGLSTWFAYYALQARAMAGDVGGALDMVRRYWGGMLSLGATTFWEHFDVNWLDNASRIDEMPTAGKVDVHTEYGGHCFKGLRHSFCHGWAGGPTAWMSQYVLGVRPAAPGFAKVMIAPELGGLEYAKGTVPTPKGIIKVEAQRNADGKVEVDYQLPQGVEIVKSGK